MSAQYNITINQNTDFIRSFQVKKNNVILDISGYTFTGRIKNSFHTTGHTSFTTSIVDAAAGTFTIALTPVQTAALEPGTNVYDVNMLDTANVTSRVLQGNAVAKQGVTP
tara:strand:+ start:153 stop:482 length:330 start_codon:yes stop_codon:yes gene_type:complete